MSNCLFCNIVEGKIPAEIVLENSELLAFNDIDPQAPFHSLIIPKKHIATLNDLRREDAMLVGEMVLFAAQLAKKQGFEGEGYRTVFNCNQVAGQTVFHMHLHVLAGRDLAWPPG